jgi:hypothetical protein
VCIVISGMNVDLWCAYRGKGGRFMQRQCLDSTATPRRDLAVNVAVPFKVDGVVYRNRLTLRLIASGSVHCLHARAYYFYLNGLSMQKVSASNSPSK